MPDSTPSTLASMIRAKYPGAYDDLDDATLEAKVDAKYPGAYSDLPRSTPTSAPVATSSSSGWPAKIGDVALGALKGLGSSLANVGEMSSYGAMGSIPRYFAAGFQNPDVAKIDAALTPTNTAQKVGRYAELAAELAGPAYSGGKAVLAAAKAAPTVTRAVTTAALDAMASETPLLTQARIKGAQLAKALLGHALDTAGTPAAQAATATTATTIPQSSTLIPQSMEEYQAALEALRPNRADAQAAFQARQAAAGTRLVTPPTAEAQMASALQDVRTASPSTAPSVQLPPPAELPPGYTPRTTVPRGTAPKTVPKVAPQPAITTPQPAIATNIPAIAPEPPAIATPAPPSRPYFLRSPQEMADIAAAKAEASPTPTGSITVADLPNAWKSKIGQDIFPTTGKIEQDVLTGLTQELQDRGLTVGQAMTAVSKNKNIPVQLRSQIQRALSKVGG